MKTSPYLSWGVITVLLTGATAYAIHRYVGLDLGWAYLVAINLATLLLYRVDKWIASGEEGTCIPNLMLVLLALAGGGAGALFGIAAGHKTSADYFWLRASVWLISMAELPLASCWLLGGAGRCVQALDALTVNWRRILLLAALAGLALLVLRWARSLIHRTLLLLKLAALVALAIGVAWMLGLRPTDLAVVPGLIRQALR